VDPALLMDRLGKVLAPDYSLLRLLGSGGMGLVYLGYDPALDRPIAIKVLNPELAIAVLQKRFLNEARHLARLAPHPHVVSIHNVQEKGGLSYYSMDYLGDETLATQLKRGRFTPDEARRMGMGVLNGLAAAHRIDVVHRDIKPSNIFMVEGRALISDFGIAHSARTDSETELTTPGQQIGTVVYMSPEQASGEPVDGRSDLYSAGLVLYEAMTGRHWRMHTPPGRGDWTDVPSGLAKVLKRALQPAPADRWPTASAFENALASLERKPIGRLPLAFALAAGLIVGAIFFWPRPQPSSCRRPSASDLAFLPFTASGEAPGVGGRDFAQMVQLDVEWFRRLRVTPEGTVACWADSVSAPLRDARAVRDLGARQVVSGLLLRQAGGWVLRITVRDSEPEPSMVLIIPGDPADVPNWSRSAADSIVHRLFPAYWNYYREIRPRGTADRQVYEDFFKGEREFQRDASNRARTYYEAALARDSTFIPATWRLSIVYRFLRVPLGDLLRKLYETRGPELPEQYRELTASLLDADLPRRFERYRTTVAKFPRDGYVRFVYADELFHHGPLVGYPLDSAMAQFDSAVAIDPDLDQMFAYDHLVYGYLRLGRRAQADSSLARRLAIPPSGEREELQRRRFLKLAFDERFRPWRASVKRWYAGLTADSTTVESINRFCRLGISFDIPGSQLGLGKILVRTGLDSVARANGHRAQGIALMAFGRPLAALPQLDTAALRWGRPDSLLERAEWRVMPGILGLPGVPATAREWGLARLKEIAGPDVVGTRALWALAVEANARGDTLAANEYASRMTMPGAARLRALTDALEEAARGRMAEALAKSEPLIADAPADLVQDPFARSLLYLRRLDWQVALHDSTAADRTRLWYLNTDIEGWPQHDLQASEVDGMMGVYARLLQAEVDHAAGRTASACDLARRVRELWSDAEPSFTDLKQRADRAADGCSS